MVIGAAPDTGSHVNAQALKVAQSTPRRKVWYRRPRATLLPWWRVAECSTPYG